MKPSGDKPLFWAFIISFINVALLFALYQLRAFDDNRLTSWKWVFAHGDPVSIFPFLVLGLTLAYGLSKVPSLEARPIFLFLCAFFLGTLFWGEPEIIVDTARYFTQAKHLEQYGVGYFIREWGRNIMAWTDLPLLPFAYGLIFEVFGEERIPIQAFTTLLFSLTVLLTYQIGKQLWHERVGFAGGFLLLGIPYLFSQVPLMLVDIPTMFFLTLAIFTTIMALEHGGTWRIIFSSLALSLAFFSKYSTWLWLSVLAPIVLLSLIRGPKEASKRACALFLLFLCIISVGIIYYHDVLAEQLRLLMSYQRPGLRRWGESFLSTFFFQTHPFMTMAGIYSIYAALRKKDLRLGIVGYLFLLIFLLQIKRIRYTLPIFPMIALMASYGLMHIENKETRRFILFSAVISSVLVAYLAYFPFLCQISTVNLKDAGRFLNALEVSRVDVVTLPQTRSIINPAIAVPLLDLYTDKGITYDPQLKAPENRERIQRSALRFTWAYIIPPYYREVGQDPGGRRALAIISSERDQALPLQVRRRAEAYSRSRSFEKSSGVFRFRTLVRVYYD